MARRSGLGKGLSSLIPTEVTGDRSTALREVPIGSIKPNPRQPRTNFDEEAMSSLAASIKELGILQPVLVRQVGGEAADEFELIAGERRWRAARRAGLHTIPVLVQSAEESHSLERALVENLHRQDLNVLEEAAAYQQLIEEFAYTHDQVAARVGRSRTAVTNTLRLLQLPTGVQRLLAEGQISPGHARALLGTPDRGYQEVLAKTIVAEGLTVRAIEDLVRDHVEQTQSVMADEGGEGDDSESGGWRRDAPLASLAATTRDSRARRAPLRLSEHPRQGGLEFTAGQGGRRVRHPRGSRTDLQADGGTERHACRVTQCSLSVVISRHHCEMTS